MKKSVKIIISIALLSSLVAFSGCAKNAKGAKATASPAASPSATSSADPAASANPSASASPAPTEKLPETAPLAYGNINLPQLETPKKDETTVIMTTSMGVIKFRFFPEEAPKSVENFIGLAKTGKYNKTIFHRVVPGFVIQGGDPKGDGTGGASIFPDGKVPLEVSPKLHNLRGALSMARSQDPNSAGSQFFIVTTKPEETDKKTLDEFKKTQTKVLGKDKDGKLVTVGDMFPEKIVDEYLKTGGAVSLDFNYSVFGHVVEGMDVVDKIAAVEYTPTSEGVKDGKPKKDVIIEKVEVIEKK